ncbi:SigE family RNA polymerase sigma factor [Dactylosporangium sp. NPDC005555]|uniref:SigE family RNA polymerase sigma factor n=1 Tax=Dactylosporangium sp. NPDC005555 TaxID=3154889 RepID=UPI0033A16671
MDPATKHEFTQFVEQRSHALFRFAYALTGAQHAAEDLLQGALAKALLKWPGITDHPESYVKRIMYRDWISVWRYRHRRPETLTAEPPEKAVADPSERTDLRLVLRDALRVLTPRQRAVIVLRYLDDMTEQQVAELLGCSTGTVASLTSRALSKLRRAAANAPTLDGATL